MQVKGMDVFIKYDMYFNIVVLNLPIGMPKLIFISWKYFINVNLIWYSVHINTFVHRNLRMYSFIRTACKRRILSECYVPVEIQL